MDDSSGETAIQRMMDRLLELALGLLGQRTANVAVQSQLNALPV